MGDWEPRYRYWVAEKGDIGWVCIRKTNSRWYARHLARRKARRGFRMKVEAQW